MRRNGWQRAKRLSRAFGAVALLGAAACGRVEEAGGDISARRVRAVATTSIVADVVREVGGDRVEVTSLMGPGVDPHLYRASEGDVRRMGDADIIFYNGLHLEGRMGEVLAEMGERGKPTIAIAEAIGEEHLLRPPEFEGAYDPHVWMDVSLWTQVVGRVTGGDRCGQRRGVPGTGESVRGALARIGRVRPAEGRAGGSRASSARDGT
jgi:ABC-type Zn uptake system ZnuABC Zn-binding protein ZnuA